MVFAEAITRLDEALELNPKKHEALWCLGNAHTSHAFLVADQEMSKSFFTKAAQCFQKAADEVHYSFKHMMWNICC